MNVPTIGHRTILLYRSIVLSYLSYPNFVLLANIIFVFPKI